MSRRLAWCAPALPALVLLLAACGGGAGKDDDPDDPGFLPPTPPEQLFLLSDAARDGSVSAYGSSSSSAILVGDDAYFNDVYTGFLSFPLASVPAEAQIVSATLQAYQLQVKGTPYDALGTLEVDQIDMGSRRDTADLTAPSIRAVGTLSSTPAVETKELDVTALVVDGLARGLTYVDLRLTFPVGTNGDGLEDRAYINDGWDTARVGRPARILVEYR